MNACMHTRNNMRAARGALLTCPCTTISKFKLNHSITTWFFRFLLICATLDWDDEPNMDIAWNVHPHGKPSSNVMQWHCNENTQRTKVCLYIMLGYQDVSYFVHKKSAKLNEMNKMLAPRNMWLWRFVFLQNRRRASSDRQFVDDVGAGSISWFVYFTWSNTTPTSAW